MHVPEFFDLAPSIILRDPLAGFLGAAQDGVLEYRYRHAVLLAGHSCPTVASAWTMLRRGLCVLYGDQLPERGGIRVELGEAADAGVAGVVASICTLITGATQNTGFKGLAGRFDRRGLLAFGQEMAANATLRLTRMDTGEMVLAGAELGRVPRPPELAQLLPRCLAGQATEIEHARFRQLWQERVRSVLMDFGDNDEVFPVLREG